MARINLSSSPVCSTPDLNPIEKFWGWLRKQLRAMDLKDALAKRPPLRKAAYRRRVRALLKSPSARAVAAAIANGLYKVCEEVVRKRGAASRG